jgi:hypothetical protein
VLPSWIFGSVLLIYLMGILAFMREPVGAAQARLIGFFCALLSGFFTYFFISTGSIDFKTPKLQASGAVAVFLVVLGLSWRKEISAPDDAAASPKESSTSDAVRPSSKEESLPSATQAGILKMVRVIFGDTGQKANLKRLRKLALICLCFTAVAVGALYAVGSRSGISIETVPPYDAIGGDTTSAQIAGSSTALSCENYYVVIYALTDKWHVQPTAGAEVDLGRDFQWHYCRWFTSTHTGTHYAALLVVRGSAFHPDEIVTELPLHGRGVVASTVVQGTKTEK